MHPEAQVLANLIDEQSRPMMTRLGHTLSRGDRSKRSAKAHRGGGLHDPRVEPTTSLPTLTNRATDPLTTLTVRDVSWLARRETKPPRKVIRRLAKLPSRDETVSQ
jgi:hypothetical protein